MELKERQGQLARQREQARLMVLKAEADLAGARDLLAQLTGALEIVSQLLAEAPLPAEPPADTK